MPPIARLAARIGDLEGMGYEFEAKAKHGDYIYKLIKRPEPKPAALFCMKRLLRRLLRLRTGPLPSRSCSAASAMT